MASNPEPATDAIQSYCEAVKRRVETSTGKKHDVYTAKTYISKPGDQIIYMVKVHVGGDNYYHLKLTRSSAGHLYKVQLLSLQTGKRLNDPLQL
ncbi:cystatin-B-like [Pygocentrus nattereri]|uniref:cystatin-B-like n=1 Tax=Pygocentrus nattereri TaxID=42514 RepID=UPI0008147404|nr:cystatin-B-like [Pygocentrus nattereri]